MSTSSVPAAVSQLEHDVNVSLAEKASVLKMLFIVLGNLADPSKCEDPKFRQLKLSNTSVQKMMRHAGIVRFLKSLGFAQQDECLKIDAIPSSIADTAAQVKTVYQRINDKLALHTTNTSSNSQPLTEKQKARALAEKKAEAEKEEARAARKRTAEQIKQDKYIRENDPNWKPSVNAAAGKSGTAISTFRDKYGE